MGYSNSHDMQISQFMNIAKVSISRAVIGIEH